MLFTSVDLTEWLGRTVTTERALLAERVAWGWLKPVLELDTRPDPVPDELFAWAVELGGIAHVNPLGLERRQLGPYEEQFSLERRTEILKEVGDSTLGGAAHKPTGCFPEPLCYPDPAW